MAIGSTAHKLILDSTQFVAGAQLSRKELGFLKDVLRQTATDTDLLAAGQDRLKMLFDKGALSTDQYSRALAKLESELAPVAELVDETGGGGSLFGRIVPTIDVLNAAGRAFDLAAGAGRAFADAIGGALTNVDDLLTISNTIGVPVDQFQNLALAADYADMSMQQAATSVEKMLTAISKGADGSKRFADVFRMLGLDAAALEAAAPDEAFAKILDAMQGIGSEADRVRVATQIFGSPDVLRMSADAIGDAERRLAMMGGHITSLDASEYGRLEMSLKDINATVDTLWRRLALELTPGLADAAEAALKLSDTAGREGTLNDGLSGLGDFSRAAGAGIKTLADAIDSMPERAPWWAETPVTWLGAAEALARATGAVGANIRESQRIIDEAAKPIRRDARDAGMRAGLDPETGLPLSPFTPLGAPDRMYEEDRAMERVVEKYRKRRIEMEMTGPFLEIYRAKLEGLKGTELDLFKAAVDKREMEKLRLADLEREVDLKRAARDIDLDIIRIGSREDAMLAARHGGFAAESRVGGSVRRPFSMAAPGVRAGGSEFSISGAGTTDFTGGTITLKSDDITAGLKEVVAAVKDDKIVIEEVTL